MKEEVEEEAVEGGGRGQLGRKSEETGCQSGAERKRERGRER